MKITDVRLGDPLYVPMRPMRDAINILPEVMTYRFIHILTDEGITGIAPFSGGELNRVLVEDVLKPKVVGEDPFNYQRIWEKMWWATFTSGRRGAHVAAIGAIDIAIWDLLGKALNKPVHKLLGGHRDEVPSYGSGVNYGYTKEELIKEMTGFVEQGFRTLKMKIGRENPEDDLERIKAVRDAIGPSIDLAIDVNNGWSVNNAIRMAKKLERYDIYWLEEPVMADDIEGFAKLAAETSIPIAAGENHYTKWEFKELIERKAVEVVQPNIARCGGVTEYIKIAAMAEAYGLPVCPHHTEYIDASLVAAVPNGLFHEYVKEFFVPAGQMYIDPIEPKDGKIAPSGKPGFGIELNKEAVERLRVRPSPEKLSRDVRKGWWWPPYL